MFRFLNDKKIKTQLEEEARQNIKLRTENQILKEKIKQLEEEKNTFQTDIEEEQMENFKHHKILLEIGRSINTPLGNYNNLLKTIKKIKALVTDYQSTN